MVFQQDPCGNSTESAWEESRQQTGSLVRPGPQSGERWKGPTGSGREKGKQEKVMRYRMDVICGMVTGLYGEKEEGVRGDP